MEQSFPRDGLRTHAGTYILLVNHATAGKKRDPV
jgi:hypothetical protein